jgi:hypothetical protein
MNAKLATSGSHLMISSKNEHTQNSGSQKYTENDKGFSLEVFSNISNKHTSRIPAPSSAYFLIYIHLGHLGQIRATKLSHRGEIFSQKQTQLSKHFPKQTQN